MERLTIRDEDNDVALNCGECSNDGSLNCDIENCYLTAICRLASIEDILGPTYDLSRLKELMEADRDGRALIIPCKEMETVYMVGINKVIHCTVRDIDIKNVDVFEYAIILYAVYISEDNEPIHITINWTKRNGKDVFLTREEAEKELEVQNGGCL